MRNGKDDDDGFKAPPGIERWPDGEPILVARPANSTTALALAHVAYKHPSEESAEALREAIAGPCTFMGYLKLASDGKPTIVDEKGNNPQQLAAGDFFISRHELSKPS